MAARSTNRFKQKPAIPFGDFMLPILGIVALGIMIIGIKILWQPQTGNVPHSPSSGSFSKIAPPVTVTQGSDGKANAVVGGITKKEEIGEIVVAAPVAKTSEPTAPAPRDEASAPAHNAKSAQKSSPAQKSSSAENKNSGAKNSAPQNPAQKSSPAQKSQASSAPAGGDAAQKSSGAGVTSVAQKSSGAGVTSVAQNGSVSKGAAVSAGSIDNSRFVVQCGSYSELAAANSVVVSLKKIDLPAVVRRAEVRGKIYYRVIVAGGSDRAVAEQVAKKVEAAGYPVLVRPND